MKSKKWNYEFKFVTVHPKLWSKKLKIKLLEWWLLNMLKLEFVLLQILFWYPCWCKRSRLCFFLFQMVGRSANVFEMVVMLKKNAYSTWKNLSVFHDLVMFRFSLTTNFRLLVRSLWSHPAVATSVRLAELAESYRKIKIFIRQSQKLNSALRYLLLRV